MSAAPDCRETRFVQIGDTLLHNERFKALSPGAFKLYVCCSMEAAGRINFQIPASKAEKYGIAAERLSTQKICKMLHINRDRPNYDAITAHAIDRLLVLAFGTDGINWNDTST